MYDDEDSAGEFEEEGMESLLRVLVTEEGEGLADVMKGIQAALVNQGKVLYKLSQAVDRSNRNKAS